MRNHSRAKYLCKTAEPVRQDGHAAPPVLRGGMTDFMQYGLVPIAILAVAVVLVFGLVNMMRGGSPHTSQKLMRLRVLLQFIAIIVIMLTIWAMRG
jgi:Hypoxia induced protein conserved region